VARRMERLTTLQAPGSRRRAGQVAASAIRMCGHARQAPALRLLAQEFGAILLSGPEPGRCDHDRGYQCPDRQVVCGGGLRRGE